MEAESSEWIMILRTVGSLALVIALIYGLSFFAQKYLLNLRLLKGGGGPFESLKVLNQVPLGPKKNLTIVEVKGRQLLLGVSDHSVSLIAELGVQNEKEVANG